MSSADENLQQADTGDTDNSATCPTVAHNTSTPSPMSPSVSTDAGEDSNAAVLSGEASHTTQHELGLASSSPEISFATQVNDPGLTIGAAWSIPWIAMANQPTTSSADWDTLMEAVHELTTTMGAAVADPQVVSVTVYSGSTTLASQPSLEIVDMPYSSSYRNTVHPALRAETYVDSLETVPLSSIPSDSMRCPICWIDFGKTIEDELDFTSHQDPGLSTEEVDHLELLKVLPFSAQDNDPVRTRCGHLFGKDCLKEVVRGGERSCPVCRMDLMGGIRVVGDS